MVVLVGAGDGGVVETGPGGVPSTAVLGIDGVVAGVLG
jgi:hypothetical protein